jgi:hypothetical protein
MSPLLADPEANEITDDDFRLTGYSGLNMLTVGFSESDPGLAGAYQSTLMPAALTTLPHFSVSSATSFA